MGSAEKYLIERTWYGDSALRWLLLPLTLLFALITSARRLLFRLRLLPVKSADVPVVVVGNITVGGTGKTPIAIWIAKELRDRGWSPGIVSRGYRGTVGSSPLEVDADSDPAVVGDEPVMIAAESQCPVVVHPNRIAAVRMLVAGGADVVIADDGLQHYRLARDVEIAVVDGERGTGNGMLLPSGPLREPAGRLSHVDSVLVQGSFDDDMPVKLPGGKVARRFRLRASAVSRLDGSIVRHLDDFSGTRVCAIAGIGNPERFFRMLEAHGIEVLRRPLPDHSAIEQRDLLTAGDVPVFMTAKDAVKCRALDTTNCWQVGVDVEFEEGAGEALMETIIQAVGPGANR
jgi:tetraacyldisaccharide 4'-kinase